MSEANWVKHKLGDLGKFSTSSVDKKTVPGQDWVKLINYMDVYRHNTINKKIDFMEVTASKKECASSTVKTGDILFVPSSETPEDICHAAVIGEPLDATLHSYHTVRFRPHSDDTFNLRFSAWLAQSQKVEEQLRRKCSGSTRYTLTIPSFKSTEVFFPKSLVVQHKIAKVLDAMELAIEQTEALIEKYSLVKAGMMHDLFTRGLTPDGKLRPAREEAPDLYKETPIGWIPKDWGYGKFGEYVAVIDPNPSHRYPDEVIEGYPICSTENFFGEDGFDFKKSKLVPEKTFQQQNNRCQYKELDVIFARKGRIGFARRYGSDKKAFSHTVVVMKPICSNIDASWLLWLSRSDWLLKAIDRKMNTNSGVPTLGVDFIKNIEIPIPSPDEQKATNTSLEAASRRIQIETDRKQKLALQKSGLMHDLLSGVVPVNVDEPEAANV